MQSISELFTKVLETTTDELYIQNPCEVVNVNGNYVDVLLYINDNEPDFVIYNVPIMRPETQRAYIFLGIKKGDRGVCRFFDRSTEGYLQSDFDYNSDDRQHDINDRVFELGFIPDKEAYEYLTTAEIEIGLKNQKFILSVDNNGNLAINANAITVTSPTITSTGSWTHNGTMTITDAITANSTITASGEIKGNGIKLSSHTHTDSQGGTTSTPS